MTALDTTSTPEAITQRSGSSFLTGFLFLGPQRRAGMTAIYAFCRVADDAVDEAATPAEGEARLQFWRAELERVERNGATTPVGEALQRTIAAFGGSLQPLRDLLDGMAMDLHAVSYADLAALEIYCHRVASVVGLACLPVLGAQGSAAERFAERLGRALQLTNILRDLRADAELGRVYAPRDWLCECGVEPLWLRGDGPDAAYAAGGPIDRLGLRLAAVARERFVEAAQALAQLPRRERRRLLPARVMGAVYRDLLRRLAARGGELRGPRVRVPKLRKLWLALRTWAGFGG